MRLTDGVAILTAAALLAGLAVLAIAVFRPGLPDPQLADRQALLRWLIMRDLANEPAATREALSRRIEGEFSEGIDWEAVCRELNAQQRQRLWENSLVLFESWVLRNSARFQTVEQTQRAAFVDGLLDRLSVWRGIERLCPQSSTSQHQQPPASLLSALLARVEALKSRCGPEVAAQIDQFVGVLSWRMLVRGLQGPEKKSPSDR